MPISTGRASDLYKALAANEDFPGAPIDVIELQCNDSPGTETEMGEKKKNCVITTARCRLPVGNCEGWATPSGVRYLGIADRRQLATVGMEGDKSSFSSPC